MPRTGYFTNLLSSKVSLMFLCHIYMVIFDTSPSVTHNEYTVGVATSRKYPLTAYVKDMGSDTSP